jgi:predicted phage tail protein
VALIALATFVPMGSIGLFGLANPIAVGPLAMKIGGLLVLSGVSQLLTPVPKMPTGEDSAQDPRKSFSFSGVQQTSRQGVPVPVVYGRTLVGSVVISAGVDTVQVG